ncbi:transcriptional regulator [Minwuia thermotolerans]|uniref:Shikimate kinase n=2 Tax=Minwuia thermotolerans TaxID=2056226 RepID=A0A2M9FZ42_9PROT|nr:transcriptional regulator [Minwuia thermotolerans]
MTMREPPARDQMDPTAAFLQGVGTRVRDARARHGMTRRDLAKHSGVSERHLAQLEAGKGNISIVLLRQVAGALATPLSELLDDGPDRSPDHRLLAGMLDQLGADQIAEARRLLEQRFVRSSERNGRLALIGLRGAGKSTVGRLVAARRGSEFVELAEEVERVAGLGLDEIFEFSGQAGYRRFEGEALRRLLGDRRQAVLATGGGIVSNPATFQMLLGGCFTIWLRADPQAHMARVVAQGDQRPMAGNRQAMEDLERILRNREALYAQADAVVDTSGLAPDAVAERVLRCWPAVRAA